jgi:hypothetical protein
LIEFIKWLYVQLSFWELGIVAIFVLFCVVIYRLDRAIDVHFKFSDFFASGDWNGKASVARLGYFGAFLCHSLIVLHKEMIDAIDSTMVSFYALIWSGAYVALKAIEMRTATQPKGDANGPESTKPVGNP